MTFRISFSVALCALSLAACALDAGGSGEFSEFGVGGGAAPPSPHAGDSRDAGKRSDASPAGASAPPSTSLGAQAVRDAASDTAAPPPAADAAPAPGPGPAKGKSAD
jgi:hypothetical protein